MCVCVHLDTDRNDLYLTIQRGEFERGAKTSQKNVEVRVLVLAKDGRHIEVVRHKSVMYLIYFKLTIFISGLLLYNMISCHCKD